MKKKELKHLIYSSFGVALVSSVVIADVVFLVLLFNG